MAKAGKPTRREVKRSPRERLTSTERDTSEHLSSVIKSARDIMRKDKGLNGDLDRLPMLTWVMFLRFLDDVERNHEVECEIEGRTYVPIIEPPYRWRDWAGNVEGPRGDDLIAFINQEEAVLPNRSRGPGLFAYLRSLRGTEEHDRRDVIATVFRETYNRMQSGYILRELLDVVNKLDFSSSKQIHAMGRVYEIMLKELRDAAGDSGEFYTPRPVIELIVEVIKPKLGEKILDPACGTGGFLVESFEYLKKQCEKTDDIIALRETLHGVEAKSLPFLLCQMNMLLHGVDSPSVVLGNSLANPLREIGDRDRVDIIMTNPPFGGEEERAILGNFPADMQTAETAYLFLQLVMRKLRRSKADQSGGRCAIIVPDGVLFGSGVGSRVRKELLESFNLHTIIRLPNGVFAPYTGIRTNILFFEHPGPTKTIWYYEHTLPEGRNSYSKTNMIRFQEFESLLRWWSDRSEQRNAWVVAVDHLSETDYNLDLKSPSPEPVDSLPSPAEVIQELVQAIDSIQHGVQELKRLIDERE